MGRESNQIKREKNCALTMTRFVCLFLPLDGVTAKFQRELTTRCVACFVNVRLNNEKKREKEKSARARALLCVCIFNRAFEDLRSCFSVECACVRYQSPYSYLAYISVSLIRYVFVLVNVCEYVNILTLCRE